MKLLEPLFLKIFYTVFPLVYNPFVSYLIIFLIFLGLALKLWNVIKKMTPQSLPSKLIKLALIILEAVLFLFLVWYILDHFQTFMILMKKIK